MKPTKFIYVPLSKNLEFQQLVAQSDTIVPCSLYVDNNNHQIYFVEEPQGPIMDCFMGSMDSCINDSIGLRIGDIIS